MRICALLLSLASSSHSLQADRCGHSPYSAGTDFNDPNITVPTLIFFSRCTLVTLVTHSFPVAIPPHTHIPISFPVQVLTGAPAATSAACCSACAVYNAKLGNNTCGIGVWHNLSPPLCVLKFSANMPVKGHLVIGFIPPPQPLVFRYAHDPLRIIHPHLCLL